MSIGSGGASLVALVLFSLNSCSVVPLAPDSPAAIMLGEWSYSSPRRTPDPPILNAGLHVAVLIDSVAGVRFWGRVTLWFAGDVGTAPDQFGRLAGQIDDQDGVTLEIPRTAPGQAALMVTGEVAGDVLTVTACQSANGSGPFPVGATFARAAQ